MRKTKIVRSIQTALALTISLSVVPILATAQEDPAEREPAAEEVRPTDAEDEGTIQGEKSAELGEITVSARKWSEDMQETPVAVTAFTEQMIIDAGIQETPDFVQLTPNVSLAESQSVSTSFLTIRGLTQVRNGEMPAAVVIDGVLQFNNRQFVQQLFDVEQIEVVKGPQGALYGRNAAGGAIIINTKPPSDESGGYVQFGVGNGDEYAVEGSFNTELVEDKLFMRLSGRSVDRDGYFTNITRQDKDDPYRDSSVRGRLTWIPSWDLSVDFKANASQHSGRGIGFQFGAEDANDTSLPFIANNEDRGERDTLGMSLKIDKELSYGTLTAISSYDDIETLTRADQFPYTELANGVPPGAPFGDGTQSQYTDISGWSQEVRLTSHDDQRLRWLAGAYYLDWSRFISSTVGLDTGQGIRRVERVPFFDVAANPTLSFFADDNENTAWALFGQLAYDITEDLEVAVAGRYDEEDRTQFVSPFNSGGAPGAVNQATFSEFQPKVSLRYLLNDNMSLYTSWGEGFRSGQFNQNGTADAAREAGINGVQDIVDPEESDSFEVGFKSDLFGNKVRLNAAYFDTTVQGQQYFVFIGGIGAQVLINIDEVDLKGFEIESVYRVTDNLQLYAAYGETDSTVKAFSTDPSLVGNRAPYIPESTINAGFQWNSQIGSFFDFFFRADYERRGEQFWSPDNLFPRSPLDLFNFRSGIESMDGRWSLIASVNNATDEEYNSEFVLPAFSHKADPRNYRLALRYNF